MKLINFLPLLLLIIAAACSTLKLQQVNFAWPVEAVLSVNDDGMVTEDRYSISFDVRGLFFEEFQDSSVSNGKKIRIIRDVNGFYFITAEKFQSVYVFKMDYGAMVLDNKINVSETGVTNPVLNQRLPDIELIDDSKSMYLTNTGILKDKK